VFSQIEAMYNGTAVQLTADYLGDDDATDSPTPVDSQVASTDVTLRSLSVISVGGVASSLYHL